MNKRGSGNSSWIIAGIDWVAANAATIEVVNMSLGGSGFSQAEYDAFQGAVNKGVAFAVAGGNEDDDANNYSPGGFDNVLSVSALADFNGLPGGGAASTCRTDVADTLADFSNWGPELDISAPGVCILSTYPLEKGEYGPISGTSMASPYAAGALALLDVSTFNPVLVPGSGGGGGTNTPPTVAISSPANGTSFASGTSISYSGSALDAEDGDLTTSLAWTSNLVASIGTGSSFSAVLGSGTHTITASVTDSGGLSGSASITITVNNPVG